MASDFPGKVYKLTTFLPGAKNSGEYVTHGEGVVAGYAHPPPVYFREDQTYTFRRAEPGKKPSIA